MNKWERAAVVLLLGATVASGLAGCGSGGKSATQSSSSTSTSEPPGGFDISRIDQLGLKLPAEDEATPIPHTTVNQDEANHLAGMRKEFVYDPPQCGAVLSKSTHLTAGSQVQGVAVRKPQQIVILAVESPAAVTDPPE